jgi:hypothetical protein
MHVGTAHVGAVGAPEQTALAQSVYAAHGLPSGHFVAQGPPQSTAGSPPLATPSTQLAGWHEPPWQTPLAQSAGPPQALPEAQRSGHTAPQSTPPSAPSFAPSVHVGAHFAVIGSHAPPVQSPLPEQP